MQFVGISNLYINGVEKKKKLLVDLGHNKGFVHGHIGRSIRRVRLMALR